MRHDSNATAAGWIQALKRDGFCIIRGLVPEEFVLETANDLAPDFAATPHSIGAFYGSTTRRFHGLLKRSPKVARFVTEPLVLEIVRSILGPHCDHVQLNLTQAIEIEPGGEAQPPHRDQDMWPVHAADTEYLINVMWPFTDYSPGNGGTLIWPQSHKKQDQILLPAEDAISPEMEPGDVLLFLGSTLHAGGANRTTHSRRGMIISYSLGWLKPYELPWLAYPPEVARTFDEELAALAGYRAHRPNLGTHEGRCPSFLLQPCTADEMGAVDALRPEQEQLIAAYRRGELTAADPSPRE
jgi:ectoine hydroxylase-related dioxygenase (phytanoyl-CoA dioxygenase family)